MKPTRRGGEMRQGRAPSIGDALVSGFPLGASGPQSYTEELCGTSFRITPQSAGEAGPTPILHWLRAVLMGP